MESKLDLTELLQCVDPSTLSYQEWVNVGMALKHEGYTAHDWDVWSQNDQRYHAGETFKKWESFQGTGSPVTGATITQLAKDNGWQSQEALNKKVKEELKNSVDNPLGSSSNPTDVNP